MQRNQREGWKRDNSEEINRHTTQKIDELVIVEFKEKSGEQSALYIAQSALKMAVFVIAAPNNATQHADSSPSCCSADYSVDKRTIAIIR